MDAAWTHENLLKLLKAIKTNISAGDRMKTFYSGANTLDWKKVAFSPFSPKDCQEKWRVLSHKLRKVRTLTELVDEAADELSNTTTKRPSDPRMIFYEENVYKYQEQYPNLKRQKLFKLITDEYNSLTEEEKAPYVEKYQHARAEYKRKIRDEGVREKRKCLSKETPQDQSETNLEESSPPPKPPKSGYNLFCKEQKASMKGIPSRNYVFVWAQRWRDLNEEERSSFNTRCFKMKRDHAQQMKAYHLKRQYPVSNQHARIKEDARPSDSEDEDMEVSTGDEEELYQSCNEDEDAGDMWFHVF
ncbi:nucleolar transcription factor 1 isoform X1 [Vanacampus margaritifer]